MPLGAEGLVISSYPSLAAVAGIYPQSGVISYAFAAAGEAVDHSIYSGGDDFTRAWTNAEMQDFRSVVARYAEVADLSFAEVANTGLSLVDLQIVDNVAGGYGGYAGPSGTFVVGSSNLYVLTHEFGHVLSLDHPFDTSFSTTVLPGVTDAYDAGDFGFNAIFYTVMAYRTGTFDDYPSYSFTAPLSLGVLDIAALQVLYGANASFEAGDTVWGLPSDITAIWDAGGTDSVDFSATTEAAVIDLRAATLLTEAGGLGRPSFVGTGGGAYTIAYGVVIENALGGTGNDRITGNEAANRLSGGGGRDRLYGDDGRDRVSGGRGNDRLYGEDGKDRLGGGNGKDWLYGGDGNDTLRGNGGRDQFVFMDGEGRDTIRDFSDDVDTLRLDEALWGGRMTAQQVIDTYASVVSGNIQFNFDDGERVTLRGFGTLAEMTDDLTLV